MSRHAATQIVRRLRQHGHAAVFAGGCVRDRLLGLTPKDYDVATDARPEVVRDLFPGSRSIGEAFGVVLVYPRRRDRRPDDPPRMGIEVATFRTEGVYSDGRRPDEVAYSDAEHDAQRRDFTVNGLFEDPLHDAQPNPLADPDGVIDYVGGRADLAGRILRAIGDPARRFAEDYLRMLRAVRFAARLGFTLAPDTADAIRTHASSLDQIARERIGDEIRAALTGPRPTLAATLLQQLQLDAPALREPHADPPLPTLDRLAPEARYPTALAAWIIDRHGRPSALNKLPDWRGALCLSNAEADALTAVLRQATAADDWGRLSVAARKRLLAAPSWDQSLLLLRALGRSATIEADTPRLHGDGIGIAPPPIITGADLLALGLAPGPRFKPLLDGAYDAQLEGKTADLESALGWVKSRLEEA
ncbi:MAG: CCA tRNA nucleotidyltransferase [Planctomycetota bacterium]